jgi:hypothetical protein
MEAQIVKSVPFLFIGLLVLLRTPSASAQAAFYGCTGGFFGAPLNCFEAPLERPNASSRTLLFGCSGGRPGEPLNCFTSETEGAMTKFIEVPPAERDEMRERKWTEKCKPHVRVDTLGVEHVTYANKRCAYGAY